MNNINSLFDNYHHVQELDPKQQALLDKCFSYIENSHVKSPAFNLPDDASPLFISTLIKKAHRDLFKNHPRAWMFFLNLMASSRFIDRIDNQALRHFIVLEMAKLCPISRFADQDLRVQLAYNAVHGHSHHRKIILAHAKHFEIEDREILADLAFKGLLLGGTSEIELIQFLPQDKKVLSQLIFTIAHSSKDKAHLELSKIKQIDPKLVETIEVHLKAI